MNDVLVKIIENKELKPVIVNENSKFVIITYWWGRGNKNANTQKPCRDELKEGDVITTEPIRYEEMIENWKKYCVNANCNYLVAEYPEFAVPGGYQNAINAKPLFIKKALESCGGRAVVYIDGDMTVNRYPHLFDMSNIDFMARGWNIDPRANMRYLKAELQFDPFTFETSGGIMYFGNTEQAKNLLDMWAKTSANKIFVGKADDRILSMIITAKNLLVTMNILQLPIEYLWLTDNYENPKDMYLDKRHYDRKYIMFEHPACLTSEEKAAEQGAAKNREPKYYDKLVEYIIDPQTEGGILNEFIVFENRDQMEGWTKYLSYISHATLYIDDDENKIHPYYLVKYNNVYGNKNDIAEENITIARSILNKLKDLPTAIPKDISYITIMKGKQIGFANNILYTTHIIPTILALHYLGYNVLYLPEVYDVSLLKNVKSKYTNKYELIVNIKNDNFNYPKFDEKSPIFFAKSSRILNHLVKISRDVQEFNKNLTECCLYIQLIRCNFTIKDQIKTPSHIRSLDRSKDIKRTIGEFNSIKSNKSKKINPNTLSLDNFSKKSLTFKIPETPKFLRMN